MRYTIDGKYLNISNADLIALSPKIMSVIIKNDVIELNLNSNLNETEYLAIRNYLNSKIENPKAEYTALTTDTAKIDYIAKKLRLK